jgi:hypothetical protein
MTKSTDRLFKVLAKTTKLDGFNVAFSEGKGWYVDFPDNTFTHMLMRKRYFINAKSFSYINFLLNRYEELCYSKKEEDLVAGFENLLRLSFLEDILR